ncbi:MAG: amidohydrolase family protein [Chloroflexi bacterium]|nr:amidohydrolase family protein [Chloroflexota bacterium]
MSKRWFLLIIGLCLLIALGIGNIHIYPPVSSSAQPIIPPRGVPADALVIKNGTVIDGTGAPPIRDGIVVITQNKIRAVGRAENFSIPASAQSLDELGGTILPGIINAHVHEAASALVRQAYFLDHGVTSVCDLGTPLTSMRQFKEPQQSSLTARGFTSGPIINVLLGYPGHWEFLYPITTTVEARAAVTDLVARGADMIKVALEPYNSKFPWAVPPREPIPGIQVNELQAIVAQAHAHNKLVRAHIGTSEMLDLALGGGVDVLEHVPLPSLNEIDFQNEFQEFGKLAPGYEAQLARLVRQNVMLVPTLSYIISWCESYALTAERKALCRKYALTPVRRFHQFGGVISLGDDSGYMARTQMPVAEMRRLAAAGLTPLEIIQASTQYAARVCGQDKMLGTLEPGKLADVIVIRGNPLADLGAFEQVSIVVMDGKVAIPKSK